jgi:hypothetical protein
LNLGSTFTLAFMADLLDSGDTPVIECTLGTDDVPERLREWRAVLDRVETREVTPEGITLHFPLDATLLGSLADIAAREVACCSFLTFALTLDAQGACLAIGAPAEAKAMVIDLFGSNEA